MRSTRSRHGPAPPGWVNTQAPFRGSGNRAVSGMDRPSTCDVARWRPAQLYCLKKQPKGSQNAAFSSAARQPGLRGDGGLRTAPLPLPLPSAPISVPANWMQSDGSGHLAPCLAPTTDQLARQLGELATWLIPGLQPPRPRPTCCGISSPPAPALTAPELCSSSHHNPCAHKHPPRDPAALRLPVPATTHRETPALIAK